MASPTTTGAAPQPERRAPTRRAQQKAETRARLLAAARRVFGEGSAVTTPLDVVASSAGVSKATLFFHFADRAELLQGVAMELQGELRQALDEAVDATPGSLRDTLGAYLRIQRDPRAALLWQVADTLFTMRQPLPETTYGTLVAEIDELLRAEGADEQRSGRLAAVLAPAAILVARRVAFGQAAEDEVAGFLDGVDAAIA